MINNKVPEFVTWFECGKIMMRDRFDESRKGKVIDFAAK